MSADRGLRRGRAAKHAHLVVMAWLIVAVPAQAFDLADVIALRQPVTAGTATFREVRHISTLTAPVERIGRLAYRRPDYLEMNVEAPHKEQVVVSGNTLRLRNAQGERTLALDSVPPLAASIEGLRATLAGDAVTLARFFDVRVAGSASAWTLDLAPRDPALRAQVDGISISGRGSAILRMQVREAGGDQTVMDIVPDLSRTP